MSAPWVLVPQWFGSLLFERETARYFPVDHEITALIPAATATLPAGGRVSISSPAGFKFIGNVDVVGKISATEDVVAAGVSLVNHPTSGVRAGGDQSGPPVPTA